MSKSPLAVARTALEAAREALPPYSHRNSPRIYTQHQLFACLVLKEFLKTDFRGLEQMLEEWSDLKEALGTGFGDNFLSTCTLTSAYIEISPKLEKYKDILTTWQSLKRFTESAKRSEIIAIILFAGKIRDIDSMHLLQMGTLDDQIKGIKEHIEMFDTR